MSLSSVHEQCHQRSVQGVFYLLYLHSFAFKYRYILYMHVLWVRICFYLVVLMWVAAEVVHQQFRA
jgi:hypothetical protein